MYCDFRYDFCVKKDVRLVLAPICFVRGSCFINVICICPTRFPYQMIFVSFNSNTTGVTCGAGKVNLSRTPEFTPRFLVGFVQSLVFNVLFCRTLYCLSFFNLQFLIIPLVSSNFSCPYTCLEV